MKNKKYKLEIDPTILELLGPSLYTNIYYILGELVANAYDADAENVYIIEKDGKLIVEDDGSGMEYGTDIKNYLNVAKITRERDSDSITKKGRKKMGRKGIGKLAALSISDEVHVMTMKNNDKSGFILSSQTDDGTLTAINEDQIRFQKNIKSGTSIIMINPKYKLHKLIDTIERNLSKIFPLVSKDFNIHIEKGDQKKIINNFDRVTIGSLSSLITLGDDFDYLSRYFKPDFYMTDLLEKRKSKIIPLTLVNKYGEEKKYNLEIKGWIGTYMSSTGRKKTFSDFPDNFISLYSNCKMGEFNILDKVGKNRMNESYVVGQLHVDLFELTELDDMALSNRQGYKTDDKRYMKVIEYVGNELLTDILKMRLKYTSLKNEEKEIAKINKMKENEGELKQKISIFKKGLINKAIREISNSKKISDSSLPIIEEIIKNEINNSMLDLSIKPEIEVNKKKILISHTGKDKKTADLIYNMMIYNNIPPEDILYTNCDDEEPRIPPGINIYDYLRDFFVDSYSKDRIFILFVTSSDMETSWGAMIEAGAAWITQTDHLLFNVNSYKPGHPLDNAKTWVSIKKQEDGEISMYMKDIDEMAIKIRLLCKKFGYNCKTKEQNKARILELVDKAD